MKLFNYEEYKAYSNILDKFPGFKERESLKYIKKITEEDCKKYQQKF